MESLATSNNVPKAPANDDAMKKTAGPVVADTTVDLLAVLREYETQIDHSYVMITKPNQYPHSQRSVYKTRNLPTVVYPNKIVAWDDLVRIMNFIKTGFFFKTDPGDNPNYNTSIVIMCPKKKHIRIMKAGEIIDRIDKLYTHNKFIQNDPTFAYDFCTICITEETFANAKSVVFSQTNMCGEHVFLKCQKGHRFVHFVDDRGSRCPMCTMEFKHRGQVRNLHDLGLKMYDHCVYINDQTELRFSCNQCGNDFYATTRMINYSTHVRDCRKNHSWPTFKAILRIKRVFEIYYNVPFDDYDDTIFDGLNIGGYNEKLKIAYLYEIDYTKEALDNLVNNCKRAGVNVFVSDKCREEHTDVIILDIYDFANRIAGGKIEKYDFIDTIRRNMHEESARNSLFRPPPVTYLQSSRCRTINIIKTSDGCKTEKK